MVVYTPNLGQPTMSRMIGHGLSADNALPSLTAAAQRNTIQRLCIVEGLLDACSCVVIFTS